MPIRILVVSIIQFFEFKVNLCLYITIKNDNNVDRYYREMTNYYGYFNVGIFN